MARSANSEIEKQLREMKKLIETLLLNQRTFGNTFQSQKPKEKATNLKNIESDQRRIELFLSKIKTQDVFNAGTKFSLENLKQSLASAKTQWRKTLTLVEISGHRSPQIEPSVTGPTETAVRDYESTLRRLGHEVKAEHLQEFRKNLSSAYAQATLKAGGKTLEIEIVEQAGKIKVRMIPK